MGTTFFIMGFILIFCIHLTCSKQLLAQSEISADIPEKIESSLEVYQSSIIEESSIIKSLQPKIVLVSIANAILIVISKIFLLSWYLLRFIIKAITTVIVLIIRVILNVILYIIAGARFILDTITSILNVILNIVVKFG